MLAIRRAALADAQAAVGLLRELGYAAEFDAVHTRLQRLLTSENDPVFVATDGDEVIGLMSLHLYEPFYGELPIGRVTALVVTERVRGSGAGAALLALAEAYFIERRCARVELTSGEHRTPAHAFYQRCGYAHTGRRFVKQLV